MTIRVLLADDHAIFCEGLHALLAQESDLNVVATAHNGFEAVRLSRAAQPQLVIIDLSMAGMNGMEAAIPALGG